MSNPLYTDKFYDDLACALLINKDFGTLPENPPSDLMRKLQAAIEHRIGKKIVLSASVGDVEESPDGKVTASLTFDYKLYYEEVNV